MVYKGGWVKNTTKTKTKGERKRRTESAAEVGEAASQLFVVG